MATSKDINNLIINKVENQEVYDYMVQNNLISDDELYLIEDNEDDKIEVDTSLSSTSENPVQNKVITSEFSKYETKNDADAKLAEAKTYTDTKTSGMATTSVVDNKISTHNTSSTAHNDIRDLISGLTTRLNTLADSDDTTLDQLSEIVTYIKSNKSLIDSITTNKVNVSDIINNLTTNVTNKPLSAAQGVAIKTLIDDLQDEVDSHTHTVADVTDLTVSAEEINYLDGVTSNVQAQLDGTMAAVDDAKTNVLINNTTDFELNSFGLKCGQDYEYIWTENADIPFDFYDNSNSSFVSFENEIYLFLNANSVYKFDGNSWSLVMGVPDYLSFSAVVVYNNEVHLIGSSLSSYRTIHYKINFNTKEYTEVSTLPYSFDEGCVVVYNNEIHILGGYDPDNFQSYAFHYKYNGTTWSKLNDLPYGFRCGSAVVYNDEIHIFGGNTDAHYKYHYKYNGTTWTRLNDLPCDFTQDSAIIYDDEIYILGCYYNNGYIPFFYRFNPHNSSWINVGELPYEFYGGGVTVCNDNMYIIGGGDSYNKTNSKNFFSCSKSSYLDLSSGEIVSLNIGNNQTVSLKAPIDDAIITETTTYSSSKIEELLEDIDVIDDAITTETTTYSSSKIEELLDEKINIDTILDVERGGTGYSTIADTTYSTVRYRASSLHSSETTPTTNGVIAWTYE